jgi:hypothetical protein
MADGYIEVSLTLEACPFSSMFPYFYFNLRLWRIIESANINGKPKS